MNRFGSLTNGLAVFREGPKVFTFVWLSQLRKLTLVLVLVFMQDLFFWQIVCANYQSIIMMYCIGLIRPFQTRSQVYLELFNEFSALVLLYHLWCFTDLQPDVDTRELIGASMIYTTCASFGLNLVIIGLNIVKTFTTKVKLRYLRYKKIKKWEEEKPEREKKLR